MTGKRRDQLGSGLRWAALALVMIPATVRASVVLSPSVGWELDPMVIAAPLVGLGPGGFALMDALAILGLALAMLADAASGRSLPRWPLGLWALGTTSALAHGVYFRGGELDHLRLGLAWSASLAGAVALLSICRDARHRSLALAFGLGFVAMLAAKGGLQVLVEHPATVRAYDADPDRFLASQGWTPGSRSALIYERRLRQPEAIGWFGLANVFATFAAAGVVTFAGFVRAGLRSRGDPDGKARLIVAVIGLAISIAALVMAGAKGGYGAATLGLALLFAGPRLARGLGPLSGLLGLGAIWLAMLAIVARGMIGEAMDELSLLFRAFYLDAAARIFFEQPLFGIGPGDFKNAYLLAKPPMSPEEVSSPHSVLLDYAATLGIGGLAWGVLVLRLAWLAGRRATEADDALATGDPARTLGVDVRLLLLGAAVATVAGATAESAASTLENAVVRLLGVGLWIGLGWAALGMLRQADAGARSLALWGAAAGGIAVLVHAQVEMTLSTPTSAALALAIVAAGAAPAAAPASARDGAPAGDTEAQAGGRRVSWAIASAAALAGVGVFVVAWWPIAAWARDMSEAYRAVDDLAELRLRAEAADPADLPRLATELTRMLGVPVHADERQVRGAWSFLASERLTVASEHLARAHARQPNHLRTSEIFQRALLRASAMSDPEAPFERRIGPAMEAESVARRLSERRPEIAEAWAHLSSVRLARAEMTENEGDGAARDRLLREAAAASRRAHELDPNGLAHPLRLTDLYTRLGDDRAARAWASRALAINDRYYLDPLRQLGDSTRERLVRLVGGG